MATKQMLDARNFLKLFTNHRTRLKCLLLNIPISITIHVCTIYPSFSISQVGKLILLLLRFVLQRKQTFSLHDEFLVKDFTINRVELKPLKEGLELSFVTFTMNTLVLMSFMLTRYLKGLFEKFYF